MGATDPVFSLGEVARATSDLSRPAGGSANGAESFAGAPGTRVAVVVRHDNDLLRSRRGLS